MKWWHGVLLFVCVSAFTLLSLGSATKESLTYDEIVHAQEGLNHIRQKTFAIDTNNPPLVRELQMLPVVVLHPAITVNEFSAETLFPARVVTIVLGALLLIAVFLVVKRFLGPNAALFATFLLTFEPTLLAHSHYITQDVGVTLFVFLTVSLMLIGLTTDVPWIWIVVGLTFGLALASKLIALPIGVVMAAVFVIKRSWFSYKPTWVQVITALLMALLVIWTAYGFTSDVVIKPRQDASRMSEKVLEYAKVHNNTLLVSALSLAKYQPIPLGQYIAVIKNASVRVLKTGEVFFMGNTYQQPSWYFMPMTFFIKLPLPLIALFLIGIFYLLRNKKKKNLWYFALPMMVTFVIVSLMGSQPWVRYGLPVIPFVVVVAAMGLPDILRGKRIGIVALLCIWFVLGTLRQYPHFISYANELTGDEKRKVTLLTDSNIDWGQSLPDIPRYIDKTHPKHISISYFGRDDASRYGLISPRAFGSYKFEDICAFHEVPLTGNGKSIVIISVSNWHACGLNKRAEYSLFRVRDILGGSLLVFY